MLSRFGRGCLSFLRATHEDVRKQQAGRDASQLPPLSQARGTQNTLFLSLLCVVALALETSKSDTKAEVLESCEIPKAAAVHLFLCNVLSPQVYQTVKRLQRWL